MKLSYDSRYNVAYIQFQEKGTEVETLRLSDQLNVDMAPDGRVYGIELLNANEQLYTTPLMPAPGSRPLADARGSESVAEPRP